MTVGTVRKRLLPRACVYTLPHDNMHVVSWQHTIGTRYPMTIYTLRIRTTLPPKGRYYRRTLCPTKFPLFFCTIFPYQISPPPQKKKINYWNARNKRCIYVCPLLNFQSLKKNKTAFAAFSVFLREKKKKRKIWGKLNSIRTSLTRKATRQHNTLRRASP